MTPDVEQRFEATPEELRRAVEDAIRTLEYRVTSQTASSVTFNTGLSFKSWAGQDITATVAGQDGAGSTLALAGHTAKALGVLPAQLYAWGEKDSLEGQVLAEVRSGLAAA